MDGLIDDLSALAHHRRRDVEPVDIDLESFVDRCWANVATSNATLAVHVEGTIRADESRLGQLFENLFRNSVEHGSTTPRSDARGDSVEHGSTESRTESGDSVEHGSTNNRRAERAGDSVEHGSTDSRPEADDSVEHGSTDATPARDAGVTVTVGTLPDGFYVADDGSGIPESERDRILEAGYSTDPNGTGLGLAIVRDVVEAHGWQLSIGESESGGARFDVTGVQALSNSSP
jgi:signal transduction histidine kinase